MAHVEPITDVGSAKRVLERHRRARERSDGGLGNRLVRPLPGHVLTTTSRCARRILASSLFTRRCRRQDPITQTPLQEPTSSSRTGPDSSFLTTTRPGSASLSGLTNWPPSSPTFVCPGGHDVAAAVSGALSRTASNLWLASKRCNCRRDWADPARACALRWVGQRSHRSLTSSRR
jgi:hypothetical protein